MPVPDSIVLSAVAETVRTGIRFDLLTEFTHDLTAFLLTRNYT
jgi:hypothetical protein